MENKTIKQFSLDLANKDCPICGGSCCALVASLASSLQEMVGNITLTKKKYEPFYDQLKHLKQESEIIRLKLLKDMQLDVDCFSVLKDAYKSKDEEQLQKAYLVALKAPMDTFTNIISLIKLLQQYYPISSKIVISDIANSAMLAYGSLYATNINIKVNTKQLNDKALALKINKQIAEELETYGQIALDIYQRINKEFDYE